MLRFEALRASVEALRANKVRAYLTALGLVIGNASVILVVTISQTSQDYILEQIRGLGSNIVYAYFETGSQGESRSQADFIKQADVEAVRSELGSRIVAVTGPVPEGAHDPPAVFQSFPARIRRRPGRSGTVTLAIRHSANLRPGHDKRARGRRLAAGHAAGAGPARWHARLHCRG